LIAFTLCPLQALLDSRPFYLQGDYFLLQNFFFTPALVDGPHTLAASETDVAGNTGSASLSFTLGSSLFDFIYVYNDGKDYYFGTVADNGTYNYQPGQTITTSGGQYTIVNQQSGAVARRLLRATRSWS